MGMIILQQLSKTIVDIFMQTSKIMPMQLHKETQSEWVLVFLMNEFWIDKGCPCLRCQREMVGRVGIFELG